MPTHVKGYDPSGEAKQFIDFLENKLVPYIVVNYRADSSDFCFFGHSAGGLLGTHILMEKPYLFNKYIIGSPSYWWDDREIINRLQNKEFIGNSKTIKFYSYIGDQEGNMMLYGWRDFNKIFITKIDSTVNFKKKLYKNENHITVTLTAFSKAVEFIYAER